MTNLIRPRTHATFASTAQQRTSAFAAAGGDNRPGMKSDIYDCPLFTGKRYRTKLSYASCWFSLHSDGTMTLSPEGITASELCDVNVSSDDVTTADSAAGGGGGVGRAGRAAHVIPAIARTTILLTLNVFILGGNGFTLITIRMTPRLWTKTTNALVRRARPPCERISWNSTAARFLVASS